MKHTHKFYPTSNAMTIGVGKKEKRFFNGKECGFVIQMLIKRKWSCECGKTKWVKEK